jgi:RNAse (barnase) inhibitor barstar
MNARRSSSEALSDLPAHCLRRLGRASAEQVQSWAAEHLEHAAIVALEDCASQAAAMRVFAGALQLPQWFGANLDALYDALTDLPGDAGWNLVVSGLAQGRLPAATREALLEVLRDAVEDASGRSRPFRVLYD